MRASRNERGRVPAFEPLPADPGRPRLDRLLKQATNVRVLDFAVRDNEVTARLAFRSSREMGRCSSEGTQEVRTERPGPVVRSGICPAPRVVKLDVEGADRAVLDGAPGMPFEDRATVVLPAHDRRQWSECESDLRVGGYQCPLEKGGTADGEDVLVTRGR